MQRAVIRGSNPGLDFNRGWVLSLSFTTVLIKISPVAVPHTVGTICPERNIPIGSQDGKDESHSPLHYNPDLYQGPMWLLFIFIQNKKAPEMLFQDLLAKLQQPICKSPPFFTAQVFISFHSKPFTSVPHFLPYSPHRRPHLQAGVLYTSHCPSNGPEVPHCIHDCFGLAAWPH